MGSMDPISAIAFGIVSGILVFIANRFQSKKQREERELEAERVATVSKAASAAVALAAVGQLLDVKAKIKEVKDTLNGDGIMKLIEEIREWQLQHEKTDQRAFKEINDKLLTILKGI